MQIEHQTFDLHETVQVPGCRCVLRHGDVELCYDYGMLQSLERPEALSKPATADVVGLYRRAFAEFGGRALWNIREVASEPTFEQALAITRQLRTEGDMSARRLAEQIEMAIRAHL